MNVLSRYKIRRVDFVDSEGVTSRNLGWFMVNPHSTIFKMWQLVRSSSFMHAEGLVLIVGIWNTGDAATDHIPKLPASLRSCVRCQ